MPTIEEGTVEVEGTEIFYRRRSGSGPPAVFVHGNPTNSSDWLPFMEKRSGPSLAFDLPGWGRSGRPDPAYTMHGMAGFFGRALAALDVGDHKLIVHDWGGMALIAAQREPDRVKKLVIINAAPLVPGYRWHWIAQLWRRRGIGEFANATFKRPVVGLVLRQARGNRKAMPDELIDSIYDTFDAGTKRAILTLYRSAPEDELEAAGRDLGKLTCPALVAWGNRDPYLAPKFGQAFAERLPNAELAELDGCGHWPWIDDPGVVDRVVGFLD